VELDYFVSENSRDTDIGSGVRMRVPIFYDLVRQQTKAAPGAAH